MNATIDLYSYRDDLIYGQYLIIFVIVISIYLSAFRPQKMLYISILIALLIVKLYFDHMPEPKSQLILFQLYILSILIPIMYILIMLYDKADSPAGFDTYMVVCVLLNTLIVQFVLRGIDSRMTALVYSGNMILTPLLLIIVSFTSVKSVSINVMLILMSIADLYYTSIRILPFGFVVVGIALIISWIKEYNSLHQSALELSEKLKMKLDDEVQLNRRIQESVKREDSVWAAYLHAQIKPHFLFNVLNSIATLCRKDVEKAYGMTLSLAKYLHNSFDFKNIEELIPIQKEIELAMSYADIEKARFPRINIDFDIHIGDSEVYVPPFCIQPLVENAIRHGLKALGNQGQVFVSIYTVIGKAVISVKNNGMFDVEYMNERINTISSTGGVGLYNVNARLVALFGTGLKFECAMTDSIVTFEVPIREDAGNV